MKQSLFFSLLLLMGSAAFSQSKAKTTFPKTPTVTAVVNVPAETQGAWMYGNFSTTEYWSTSPKTYLGNAFTMAMAFVFKADGTYEHYFTSQVTNFTGATYHQSLTKGTYTVDAVNKTITTTALSSHYKRTERGKVAEDRDMRPDEIKKKDVYTYTVGTEPSGTQAIYLTPYGTKSTLTFLKKDF